MLSSLIVLNLLESNSENKFLHRSTSSYEFILKKCFIKCNLVLLVSESSKRLQIIFVALAFGTSPAIRLLCKKEKPRLCRSSQGFEKCGGFVDP